MGKTERQGLVARQHPDPGGGHQLDRRGDDGRGDVSRGGGEDRRRDRQLQVRSARLRRNGRRRRLGMR